MLMKSYSFLSAVICCSLALSRAAADVPEATYIFPAGGQRGTTVDVRIGGLHLHDECPIYIGATDVTAPPTIRRTEKIWFEGPIIGQPDSQKAEDYPSDYAAKLTIAADAELGIRRWRVATSQGVVPSRKFIVGDLSEIVEHEIDGPEPPTPVTTPLTINGRIFPREDVDAWSFQGRKGQTIRCEVMAERLGSPLDSQLEIFDAAGKRLALNSDHFGADSFLLFTPPADGEYRIRIFDAAYGGLQTYVYRLTLSEQPHITSVYPLGAKRGAEAEFELTGLQMPPAPQQLAVPSDVAEAFVATFLIHGRPANPVTLEIGDREEVLEAEPNSTPEQARAFGPSITANGRIDAAGDDDGWVFEGKKGQGVEFELRAARLGSPLDGVLTLVDETGKEIATNDDATTTDVDPRLRTILPADGRYLVRVTDRSPHRGGRDFAYRLLMKNAEPDFTLTLAADAVVVERGVEGVKPQRFKVQAVRTPGVDVPIDLVLDGLPNGVTVKGNRIDKGRPEAQLSFEAAADAPIAVHTLTVRGVAKVGDREIVRTATMPVAWGEPPLDKMQLAVALPTPFKVTGIFNLPYASRGTVYVRRFGLERTGYDGPITVKLAEKQMRHLQGVEGPTIELPAGATEFDYPVNLPPWMELARTSRSVVAATAQVDDGTGKKHWVSYTSVAPSEQISLIISPGPLTVDVEPTTIVPRTEAPAEVAVQIDRDPALKGPVRVELVMPMHVRGVSAEPVVLPAGSERGTLRLRFTADAGPFNMPLTIRAVHGNGADRIVAESAIELIAPR
jgi:hypothetical protein